MEGVFVESKGEINYNKSQFRQGIDIDYDPNNFLKDVGKVKRVLWIVP